jgi:hypothetical protein
MIIKPANTIPITPGKSCSIGVSLKNNHPKIKEEGIPRYSNGARVLGDITLYA